MMAGTAAVRFSTCVIRRARASRSPASMRSTRPLVLGSGMAGRAAIVAPLLGWPIVRAPTVLLVLLAGTAPRPWLDRLAILVPAPAATRWLLIADVACLVALGVATGRPRLGVPFMLGAGFI